MNDETLLIFDCDGTLVDSEGIANQVFIEGVNALGIPLTEEEAWKHFPGTSMALCIKYVEETYNVILPEDFVPQQRVRQKDAFKKQLRPIPGAPEALDRLQIPKCVASNGPLEVILENLNTTRLLHHFGQRIYSAYVIEKWKPLPDLFQHAARAAGVPPENCLVIEDSDAGMQAGIAAGMTVLGYLPSSNKYRVETHGIIPFDDMKNLPELIAETLQ
ncbi:MAG: HAD-IA family hydrolase [Saprospiraceae bacterium]|nr:HAD-IA family hydrolase [Saprospiraceae bacterium]